MSMISEKFAATAFCVVVLCGVSLAQAPPPAILYIDVENGVQYLEDNISDVSKFATNPGVVNLGSAPRNFGKWVIIADIVSVNGQPARGTLVYNTRTITLSPTPNAGEAIADIVRTGAIQITVEILKTDGTPVGTIMALGLAAGPPPPGSPLAQMRANNTIVGGTGAFLGVRGQSGSRVPQQVYPIRMASMAEDPANRRINGGGTSGIVLHVIPMSRPEIMATTTGPAIFHADLSPITAAKPAKAGEVLIVRATGLGPTVPGVDPGQAFPLDAPLQVNSPLAVSVNGKPADVINGIGWPGQVDTYRVDFRVPDGTAAGTASIQLTAAWIAGPSVNIAVQ